MRWYHGTDTNQATPFPNCGDPAHFYVGRLGGEETAGGTGLDEAAVAALRPEHCFGYWDLAGPDGAQPGQTYSDWGLAQAKAFYHAWSSGAFHTRVKGATLFLDIEPGNGGWLSGGTTTEQSFNRDVLYGALRFLNNRERGTTAGIYISTGDWDVYFGSTYRSPLPFVFWLAGTTCPSDCVAAENTFPVHVHRGGLQVMIWQYRVPGCSGNQDFNLTPFNGFLTGQWHPTRVGMSEL